MTELLNNPIVYDDVFSYKDCTKFYEELDNSPNWCYNMSAVRGGFMGTILPHRAWGIDLLNPKTQYFNDNTPEWVAGHISADSGVAMHRTDNLLAKPGLLSYLDARTNHSMNLANREIIFAHFNGQTYGQDAPYHKDDQISVMVYLTVPWQEDWGGELRFLDTNWKSEADFRQIEYKPGRVIIIAGNQVHRNMAPTVKNVLRVSFSIHLGRQFEYKIIC
jgi:hypothetical protein